MNKRSIAGIGLAGAMALVAGCSMMGGETKGPGGQRVTLSGDNQVPPVSTPASGTATVTVGADCSVTASVSVSGMTATASHIHEGAPGKNGPVIVPFTKTGDNQFGAAPGAKMTDSQCAAYKAGNTYVNVHSARNPGGEVRGQLKGS